MSTATTRDTPMGGGTNPDLSGFQRDVLLVIAQSQEGDETPYGLGIKSRLEDRYGEDVNHGRLYPNLDGLVERGLVEKDAIDDRTNSYTLTDDGRAVLEARCEELADVLGWV